MLENFTELNQELPSDRIIKQILNLISSGQLKPGNRLPSERKLAEKLGVGRTIVKSCLLYTSPSPRDATLSRMPSSA